MKEHCRLDSSNQPFHIHPEGDFPNPTRKNHVPFSSYSFLDMQGLSTLAPEKVAFLRSMGCLEIPKPALLEDFVCQYFRHLHPSVPVIDEAAFWRLYRQECEDSSAFRISLPLFQALLFASSPYISASTAQDCGFDDTRAAWKTLYQRAKVRPPRVYLGLILTRTGAFPSRVGRWTT